MLSLETNVKLSHTLIHNLILLDTVSHTVGAYYSQVFLANIALEGEINPITLGGFVETFFSEIKDTLWYTQESKEEAVAFCNLVNDYYMNPTQENADLIIEHMV